MVSIKAGVEHLLDKFTTLPADEFDIEHHGTIVEDALPDIIRSSGDVLVNVHTKTKDNELQMHLDIQDSKFTELKQSAAAAISDIHNRRPMTGGATENRPFNRRISLPSAKERSVYSREESDGESAYGDNNIDTEDEITRNGLKKSSSYILIAQEERRKLSSSNHP